MTPKQRAYIENRIAGLAPKQAAIAAGYAPTGADQAASVMEKRADVQKAIKKKVVPGPNAAGSARGRRPDADKSGEFVETAQEEGESWMKDHYDSPLDLFLHVMSEPRARPALRFEAAKQAAPYVHGKVAPAAAKGKKAEAEERAKDKATGGKFRRRAAPSKPAVRLN